MDANLVRAIIWLTAYSVITHGTVLHCRYCFKYYLESCDGKFRQELGYVALSEENLQQTKQCSNEPFKPGFGLPGFGAGTGGQISPDDQFISGPDDQFISGPGDQEYLQVDPGFGETGQNSIYGLPKPNQPSPEGRFPGHFNVEHSVESEAQLLYDDQDRPLGQTVPEGYDISGRLLGPNQPFREGQPPGHLNIEHSFDSDGAQILNDAQGKPLGQPVPQRYDDHGRPLPKIGERLYDDQGRLLEQPSPQIYDDQGKPFRPTGALGYDDQGRPLGKNRPSQEGQLPGHLNIEHSFDSEVQILYDDEGRPFSPQAYKDQGRPSQEYDSQGRPLGPNRPFQGGQLPGHLNIEHSIESEGSQIFYDDQGTPFRQPGPQRYDDQGRPLPPTGPQGNDIPLVITGTQGQGVGEADGLDQVVIVHDVKTPGEPLGYSTGEESLAVGSQQNAYGGNINVGQAKVNPGGIQSNQQLGYPGEGVSIELSGEHGVPLGLLTGQHPSYPNGVQPGQPAYLNEKDSNGQGYLGVKTEQPGYHGDVQPGQPGYMGPGGSIQMNNQQAEYTDVQGGQNPGYSGDVKPGKPEYMGHGGVIGIDSQPGGYTGVQTSSNEVQPGQPGYMNQGVSMGPGSQPEGYLNTPTGLEHDFEQSEEVEHEVYHVILPGDKQDSVENYELHPAHELQVHLNDKLELDKLVNNELAGQVGSQDNVQYKGYADYEHQQNNLLHQFSGVGSEQQSNKPGGKGPNQQNIHPGKPNSGQQPGYPGVPNSGQQFVYPDDSKYNPDIGYLVTADGSSLHTEHTGVGVFDQKPGYPGGVNSGQDPGFTGGPNTYPKPVYSEESSPGQNLNNPGGNNPNQQTTYPGGQTSGYYVGLESGQQPGTHESSNHYEGYFDGQQPYAGTVHSGQQPANSGVQTPGQKPAYFEEINQYLSSLAGSNQQQNVPSNNAVQGDIGSNVYDVEHEVYHVVQPDGKPNAIENYELESANGVPVNQEDFSQMSHLINNELLMDSGSGKIHGYAEYGHQTDDQVQLGTQQGSTSVNTEPQSSYSGGIGIGGVGSGHQTDYSGGLQSGQKPGFQIMGGESGTNQPGGYSADFRPGHQTRYPTGHIPYTKLEGDGISETSGQPGKYVEGQQREYPNGLRPGQYKGNPGMGVSFEISHEGEYTAALNTDQKPNAMGLIPGYTDGFGNFVNINPQEGYTDGQQESNPNGLRPSQQSGTIGINGELEINEQRGYVSGVQNSKPPVYPGGLRPGQQSSYHIDGGSMQTGPQPEGYLEGANTDQNFSGGKGPSQHMNPQSQSSGSPYGQPGAQHPLDLEHEVYHVVHPEGTPNEIGSYVLQPANPAEVQQEDKMEINKHLTPQLSEEAGSQQNVHFAGFEGYEHLSNEQKNGQVLGQHGYKQYPEGHPQSAGIEIYGQYPEGSLEHNALLALEQGGSTQGMGIPSQSGSTTGSQQSDYPGSGTIEHHGVYPDSSLANQAQLIGGIGTSQSKYPSSGAVGNYGLKPKGSLEIEHLEQNAGSGVIGGMKPGSDFFYPGSSGKYNRNPYGKYQHSYGKRPYHFQSDEDQNPMEESIEHEYEHTIQMEPDENQSGLIQFEKDQSADGMYSNSRDSNPLLRRPGKGGAIGGLYHYLQVPSKHQVVQHVVHHHVHIPAVPQGLPDMSGLTEEEKIEYLKKYGIDCELPPDGKSHKPGYNWYNKFINYNKTPQELPVKTPYVDKSGDKHFLFSHYGSPNGITLPGKGPRLPPQFNNNKVFPKMEGSGKTKSEVQDNSLLNYQSYALLNNKNYQKIHPSDVSRNPPNFNPHYGPHRALFPSIFKGYPAKQDEIQEKSRVRQLGSVGYAHGKHAKFDEGRGKIYHKIVHKSRRRTRKMSRRNLDGSTESENDNYTTENSNEPVEGDSDENESKSDVLIHHGIEDSKEAKESVEEDNENDEVAANTLAPAGDAEIAASSKSASASANNNQQHKNNEKVKTNNVEVTTELNDAAEVESEQIEKAHETENSEPTAEQDESVNE